MKIVTWNIIQGNGTYAARCFTLIKNFAERNQIKLVLLRRESRGANDLLAKAKLNPANGQYPVLVILHNDGEVATGLLQPLEKTLQDALDKYGKSDPTWGGTSADEPLLTRRKQPIRGLTYSRLDDPNYPFDLD